MCCTELTKLKHTGGTGGAVGVHNSQEGGSESDPKLNHTRTVPGSQDNSSSSDRSNDDGQADSLSKEARSPNKDGCYTHGLGKGALMAKIDLKSAFQIISVHCTDWDPLGMHWWGQCYVDTCLPFSLRSAPFLFNEYTTAVKWIMTCNYQLHHLIHYLDDFFLAALPQPSCCQRDLDTFLQVASKLRRCASSHGEG